MELFLHFLLIFAGAIVAIFIMTIFFGAPYVPTHAEDLRKTFRKINISKDDILADIGSGDGIVLKIAGEMGAKTIGFEINPILVAVSKFRLRKLKNSEIYLANFWSAFPLKKVTIMHTFGDSVRINAMLELAQKQADAQNSPLKFISYGIEAPNAQPSKKIGAHFIYEILPNSKKVLKK